MIIDLIRRQEKIILLPDGTTPTVPSVADHTQPDWLETDIYKGEIAFCRSGSTYNMYSRDDVGVFMLPRWDYIAQVLDAQYIDLVGIINTRANVFFQDMFQPTNGQTEFQLSGNHSWTGVLQIFVNGNLSNEDFTLYGTTLTFIATQYTLTPTDIIVVIYN